MNFNPHALFITTVGFVLANTVTAQTNLASKELKSQILNPVTDDLSMTLNTQYLSQDSEVNKTNRFRTRAEFDFKKSIVKYLDFNLDAAISLETGNSDSLYQNANEFEPTNAIILQRGEFTFSPFNFVALRAGAVKIDNDNHRLLIGRNVFLGAAEEFSYKYNEFSISAVAYQTSPRNVNYSNRLDSVEEGDPNFFMESLSLRYGNENDYLSASYSSYAFANLSNSVAGISYLHGNTVNLDDSASGEFVYSYIGNSTRVEGQMDSRYIKMKAFGEALVNNSAPKNNQGTLVGAIGYYHIGDHDIYLGYSNFKTEADATVAYYADPTFRRTNVEGTLTTVGYQNNKEGLSVEIGLVNSQEILKSDLSENSQEQIIQFSLRKVYDIF